MTRVLDSFDFERVHTAMAALGWTYTGEVKTPAIPRLRATAGQLLESAAIERNDGAEFQCGGFRASWHAGNSVVLRFEIASACATLAQ